MGYGDFAYYYDALNHEANYDRLCDEMVLRLCRHGVCDGLVADLGCGTGEVSLRLARAGYDLISVDASENMLSVFRDKLASMNQTGILLLHQMLQELDLYGTIRAAVCTFDTLNHIEPDKINEVLRRVSLFLEPGGVFIFDANTPYKHEAILADKPFFIEGEGGIECLWQNKPTLNGKATKIELHISRQGQTMARECFIEYVYPLAFWEEKLKENGLKTQEILDGENFFPLFRESQRYFILAVKP